jgi:hypothetical protein
MKKKPSSLNPAANERIDDDNDVSVARKTKETDEKGEKKSSVVLQRRERKAHHLNLLDSFTSA